MARLRIIEETTALTYETEGDSPRKAIEEMVSVLGLVLDEMTFYVEDLDNQRSVVMTWPFDEMPEVEYGQSIG